MRDIEDYPKRKRPWRIREGNFTYQYTYYFSTYILYKKKKNKGKKDKRQKMSQEIT